MQGVRDGIGPIRGPGLSVHPIFDLDPCLDLLFVGAKDAVHVLPQRIFRALPVVDQGHHARVQNKYPFAGLGLDFPAQILELFVVGGLDPAQKLDHALCNSASVADERLSRGLGP